MIRAAHGLLPIACVVALAGCGLQAYKPGDLHPERTAAAFLARSPDDPAAKASLESQGIAVPEWPLKAWTFPQLAVLAANFHPDLRVARDNAAAFEAALATATQPALPTAKPLVEHHSRTDGDRSPWSIGLELEFPLGSPGRREAAIDEARARADAAVVEAAAAGWQVRSRVWRAYVECYAAGAGLALAGQEQAAIARELALARRRLEAGATDSPEVAAVQLRLDQASARNAEARSRAAGSLAQLAAATGLPPERAEGLRLDFAELDRAPAPPDGGALREAALTQRHDLRLTLLAYAEADAALRVAVARQYPDIQLKPGFLWDQGDRIWMLALSIPLQLLQDRSAPVREAEARREREASRFVAVQARAIAEAEAARSSYAASLERLAAARRMEDAARAQAARSERAVAAGTASRGEAIGSTLALLEAERGRAQALAAAQLARGVLEDAAERPMDPAPPPPRVAPVAEAGATR